MEKQKPTEEEEGDRREKRLLSSAGLSTCKPPSPRDGGLRYGLLSLKFSRSSLQSPHKKPFIHQSHKKKEEKTEKEIKTITETLTLDLDQPRGAANTRKNRHRRPGRRRCVYIYRNFDPVLLGSTIPPGRHWSAHDGPGCLSLSGYDHSNPVISEHVARTATSASSRAEDRWDRRFRANHGITQTPDGEGRTMLCTGRIIACCSSSSSSSSHVTATAATSAPYGGFLIQRDWKSSSLLLRERKVGGFDLRCRSVAGSGNPPDATPSSAEPSVSANDFEKNPSR